MGAYLGLLVLASVYAAVYSVHAFKQKNPGGGAAAVVSALLPLGMAAALFFGFVRG